jgi:anti-anti-sigma regulatory factor
MKKYPKKGTNTFRLLELLQKLKTLTGIQIIEMLGFISYNTAIFQLRHRYGYIIDCTKVHSSDGSVYGVFTLLI